MQVLLWFYPGRSDPHARPLVRAHAVWAVFRLGGAALLQEATRNETDPLVRAEYEAEAREVA